VTLFGLPSDDPLSASVLHITRGSRINAVGTANSPIVLMRGRRLRYQPRRVGWRADQRFRTAQRLRH
jgi:hypothetical protein